MTTKESDPKNIAEHQLSKQEVILTVSGCLTAGEHGRQHILTSVYRKVTAFAQNAGLKSKESGKIK